MEVYPVDIDPGQVVRWIKEELEAAPSSFRIAARRAREVREIPAVREVHLGDQERENLSEISTIATLEIAPVRASDGWVLNIVIEDEAGPRLSDRETAEQVEQQIDLGTFYNEFIRPERGSANVVAEVEGPAARTRVNRLLRSIEKNLHSPRRGTSKP